MSAPEPAVEGGAEQGRQRRPDNEQADQHDRGDQQQRHHLADHRSPAGPVHLGVFVLHAFSVAAARQSDDVNPMKESSGSQFYITQGKVFTDPGLDSVETYRLNGRKIPQEQREVYKTIGGIPHLDQGYTVFGEVVSGLDVIDKIAAVATSRAQDRDRPLENVLIIKATLVKRKKNKK